MENSTHAPESRQVLEITDIMAILPHRYPFLLIDRVIEI
jgi:3-hydroxyacyl-[acyl-carrier-protein] dehydratase